MKKLITALFSIFLTCSCMTVSTHNIPSVDLKRPTVEKSQRKKVVYTVKYDATGAYRNIFQMNGDFSQHKIAPIVRKNLEETSLYDTLTWGTSGDYHFEFSFYQSGTNINDTGPMVAQMVSGVTLWTIPSWSSTNLDGTMRYFVKGKEIYNVTIGETLKEIYWWPGLIFIYPFKSSDPEGDVINTMMQFFIKHIEDNKLY